MLYKFICSLSVHHHCHHFHNASLLLSSLQSKNLLFPQILPIIAYLTFLDWSDSFLSPFPNVVSSHQFFWFCFSLLSFLSDFCDRLNSFNQLSNCTLNLITFQFLIFIFCTVCNWNIAKRMHFWQYRVVQKSGHLRNSMGVCFFGPPCIWFMVILLYVKC